MQSLAIKVDNVSMGFRLSNEKVDSLKEYLIRILQGKNSFSEFNALRNISFKINTGEKVGLIGHNGAGKSTLLKIISGVMKPTSGRIYTNGNIAPLLELGAGFDINLSGAENIYLNGAILGKSKEFLMEKYDEIVEFSGINKFIHTPVKNYSSGMRARLGFSIATQIDPDILIIDEILSVGDEQFRKKSFEKMNELMDSGKTLILVSHSLNNIKNFTDKVIWLHNGQIKRIGETEAICNEYKEFQNEKQKQTTD